MITSRPRYTLGLIAATLVTLSACGGGGNTGASPATNATIRGIAATGTAIGNGQVSLKCSSGSVAATTTNPDGSFSLDASTVTPPCIARVDYRDSSGAAQKLHSLVKAAGTSNITPITELVVAQLSSTGSASDAFDRFDAAEVRTFDAARVSTAIDVVKTALAARGLDLSHLKSDPIGTPFVAAHGSTQGDEQDRILDDMRDQLTVQHKNLHDLETEMKQGSETHDLSTSTGLAGDAVAGKAAYDTNCLSCHGMRLPDAVNASRILAAIKDNEGAMGALAITITSATADNIATYMASLISGNTRTALQTQTISFTSPGQQTMGVAPPVLAATASSGLPVTIVSVTPSVCTVTNFALSLVAPGNCSLKATQAGNVTFNAAVPVLNAFTVASASGAVLTSQSISFASPGAQTVGIAATLSATASSGLAVTFGSSTPAVCSVSGNLLTLIATGNCTITANQTGSSIYAAAAPLTRTFPVTQPAPVALAGSATNGKGLYTSNCISCHGATPSGFVLNGRTVSLLQGAISSNMGGMGRLSGLTAQNLADIAAYLATPTI